MNQRNAHGERTVRVFLVCAPHFLLRADACGFGILQIRRFFVLPDGTREDPRAGPSLDFPGPKGEGASPSFGNYLHPLGYNLMYETKAPSNEG